MKKIKYLMISIFTAVILAACSNQMYSWSYSPINTHYSKELNQINLGMTKQELLKILPNLVPRGQTYVAESIVEGLELKHNYWAGVGGRLVEDKLWFYIHNNTLVKWGKPNDWPAKPDLIIEKRVR